MRRLAAVLCVLTAFVPAGARANSTTIFVPFGYGEAVHSTSSGLANRSFATASASASRAGALSGSVTMDSKVGGSIPFASSAYADAMSEVGGSVEVPDGLTSITLTVRLHITRIGVEQDAALSPATAGLWFEPWISKPPGCDFCYEAVTSGGHVDPGDSIEDEDLVVTAELVNDEGALPGGRYTVRLQAHAWAYAGMAKSRASANYDVTVTSLEVTF